MLIFICDDNRQDLEVMRMHLAKAAAGLSADVKIAAYSSGKMLLKAVEDGANPVLALLDIYMDDMNGIAVGRALRALQPDVFLAYLTSSRDFAVDAFEMDALHYMVKPVTSDMFHTLLMRLTDRMERFTRVLDLPVGRGEHARFPLAKIRHITSKSRGVEIGVQGRSNTWLPCLFREVEARLSDEPDFLLLSRGCMINLNSVQRIDYDVCHLKNGEIFPISRRERAKVQSRYSDFLFCRMNTMEREKND